MKFYIKITHNNGHNQFHYETLNEAVKKYTAFVKAFDTGDSLFESTFQGCTGIAIYVVDPVHGHICLEEI